MKRVSCGLALGTVLLLGVRASAQTPAGNGQQAPAMTNLQVWPKDTSPAVVLQFMNAFGDSLGITCDYCHVQRDGKFDFASDDKREKRVARQMILLRDSINVVLPAIVLGTGGTRLRDVGTRARKQAEALLGTRVYLDLRVKVAKDWQRDPAQLRRLGF